MEIKQTYLTQTSIFKKQELLSPKGIILYAIGCPQPSAKVLIHNWNRENFKDACPHALVDANDGKCYQLLPWEIKGSHAKSEVDDAYIGIAMCEPSVIKYIKKRKFKIFSQDIALNVMNKTIASAVELCASLCIAYDFSPETDILSAKECTEIGSSTRFVDPEHLWDGLGSSFIMNDFRTSVVKKMEKIYNRVATISTAAFGTPEEMEIFKVGQSDPIKMIRVSVPNLRIRTGPGRENMATGEFTGIGDFEISDCQNGSGSNKGWAKLSDGRGWVSLDYAEVL